MERPPKQSPNRRCGYCGDGLVCEHGYCEVCMNCADCDIEELRIAKEVQS